MYVYFKKAKHVISPDGPLLNPPFRAIIGGQIQPMNTHATNLSNSAAYEPGSAWVVRILSVNQVSRMVTVTHQS